VGEQLTGGRTSFRITEPLGYGKTYMWSGRVSGADGAARSAFSASISARSASTSLRSSRLWASPDGRLFWPRIIIHIIRPIPTGHANTASVEKADSIVHSQLRGDPSE
jgi:hypothetical protein